VEGDSGARQHKGEAICINEYFTQHPHLMLGKMELSGSMYRDKEPTLVSDGRDLAEALAQAISNLPNNIYRAQKRVVPRPLSTRRFPPRPSQPNAS